MNPTAAQDSLAISGMDARDAAKAPDHAPIADHPEPGARF